MPLHRLTRRRSLLEWVPPIATRAKDIVLVLVLFQVVDRWTKIVLPVTVVDVRSALDAVDTREQARILRDGR